MANLAAADVTYTPKMQGTDANSRKHNIIQLSFGDGAKTYPAGGIPLLPAKMGCPNKLYSLQVVDQGLSGYKFQVDLTNNKLIMLQAASHSHDLLLKNAAVADGVTTRINAGTNLIGANTGSDITVAGGGANGGVVAKAPGALAEISGLAPAAQTLLVEVIGW